MYPLLATKLKVPVHISVPQLLFCALLSCTVWARSTTPWSITVSYLGAHPIINPTCRLLIAQLLGAH